MLSRYYMSLSVITPSVVHLTPNELKLLFWQQHSIKMQASVESRVEYALKTTALEEGFYY